MASSSSVARLLIRDGKSAASLLFRTRTTNLTETVRNTGPTIRALLRLNQMPAIQYPVFSETFPVMQSGFHVDVGGFIQKESFGKMELGQGKPVVNNESGDWEEDETDFDEDDIDDIDVSEDDEFDDSEEQDEEDEEEECTRKMNK